MFGLTFKVLAGGFGTGVGSFAAGEFKLPAGGSWKNQTVPASILADVGVATQENVKEFGGAAGMGLVASRLWLTIKSADKTLFAKGKHADKCWRRLIQDCDDHLTTLAGNDAPPTRLAQH